MPFQCLTPPQATLQATSNLPTATYGRITQQSAHDIPHWPGAPSTNNRSSQEQGNILRNASLVDPEGPIFSVPRCHTARNSPVSSNSDALHCGSPRGSSLQGSGPSGPLPSIRNQILESGDHSLGYFRLCYKRRSLRVDKNMGQSDMMSEEEEANDVEYSAQKKRPNSKRAGMRKPACGGLDSERDHVPLSRYDPSPTSRKKSRILDRPSIPRYAPIEAGLLEAFRHVQVQPNFREMISTTNDQGQTLAHLSILYGYPSLLSSLVDWRINLTIADVNGLTALHYAYMQGDLDSVRTLRSGGASELVMDSLGRTPLDMQPEGFGSSIDNDTKVSLELDLGVHPLCGDSDE